MKNLMQKPVVEFMTTEVIAVKKNESIKNVFKLMDEGAILGLPVVDDSNVVIGMVTESDLVKHFTTLKEPRSINLLGSIVYLEDIRDFNKTLKDHCAETVGDLMRTEAVVINKDDSLLDAIDMMSKKDVNRLSVIDKENKLIGILTRTVIVHQLAKLK